MRVLVTGGAGFIGAHLVRELIGRGCAVRVVDDLSTGREENLPVEVDFLREDINRIGNHISFLESVDVIVHLAARVTIRGSMDDTREDLHHNLMGTVALLEAMRIKPIKRLVFASSMGVYSNATDGQFISEDHRTEPIAPYGVSKLASEHHIRIFGRQHAIETIILRLFNTWGMGQAYSPYVGLITIACQHASEGRVIPVFGDGLQTRDFVHVDDVVVAFWKSLEFQFAQDKSHLTCNIGTGIPRTVLDVLEAVQAASSARLQWKFCDARKEELRHAVANIRHAGDMLGYSPKHTELELQPIFMDIQRRFEATKRTSLNA